MKTTDPRFAQRVKDLQKVLGLVGAAVDGQFGHATLSLIEDKLLPPVQVSTPEVPKTPEPSPTPNAGVDARSARNILTLNPKVRHAFERLVIEGTRIARELGAESYVLISGNRTYAEQDALYAKGRTTTGPVVTNARAGYSNHNFGIPGWPAESTRL
jgi:peptidoglycan L-alanyl-D-glutamate endopeptidase CwlK